MTKLETFTDDQRRQVGPLVTTEHFTLQTARAATISEANGRASLFLGTVSSAIVALAFIGQVDETMTAFFSFAFVLFPVLIFLGVATFSRVLQSGIEDSIYARAISRLRHLYTELVPPLADYFVLSTHDDAVAFVRDLGVRPGRWQMFLTTAGTIGVINSVLVGVLVGLVADRFGAGVWLAVAVGLVLFVVGVFLHQRYQAQQWEAAEKSIPAMFPSEGASQR